LPIAGSVDWGLTAMSPIIRLFPRTRHGRFRESDLLRKLFETVVARCMKERIVGGEALNGHGSQERRMKRSTPTPGHLAQMKFSPTRLRATSGIPLDVGRAVAAFEHSLAAEHPIGVAEVG
jgi:hypothetical protein